MQPSRKYRNNMRAAIRLFSSHEDETMLAPDGVGYLSMSDLEAAYELVMGYKAKPPRKYRSSRLR